MIEITVPLAPVTKKNSMRIVRNRKTGKRRIMPSQQYMDYEAEAVWHCKRAKVQRPIEEPVEVKCLFYMPTRRRVDLTNLLESIDDVLVKSGVLKDDHSGIIVSHDGSRVLYDKDNPRTVLFIREMEDMDATTRDARM
jgi:Holliday junction resolvase RusA-like endonuclease|nr:MAG TPA: Endodeoxyribonuclease RusA [Caudoviricetes sp.]